MTRESNRGEDVETLRTNAFAQVKLLHEAIMAYHKQILRTQPATTGPIEVTEPAPISGEPTRALLEVQGHLQGALRRNEELAMEMAAFRQQEVEWKRTVDQLKHQLSMLSSQLQHQQATHDAQRKQLQMKDTLLANYRASIRTLENKPITTYFIKLILQAKR
ncbi:hypothetical protein ACHHYP_20509 [Achlya hypogyna]|uniref:Uncharacterized protein n=1 Tax=Achlya hypogyna TaxID=1202772 RepID=A0A1V9YK97_ACHHY|nr:hypothetical protein ACHHYP_20509 [Achlya hypogyna]